MPKNKLFDDNDSEEESVLIKTENEYAKRYDNWREKEELHKLEQKYGDKDLNAPISSDSEDEDEEPPDMPEEMEAQFLKTLSLLKTKDPRIYDPSFKFFDSAEVGNIKGEEKTEVEVKPKKEVNSLAAAFADSDDDEEDGEIFKVEKKAPEPQKQSKEIKIKEYLSGKVDHVDPDEEKDLAPLRALWSDPQLNQDEAFLRDYILNKKYLEPDSSVGVAGGAGPKLLDSTELAADEELVEEQGRFERAYNFRFEEPDQEYLKRYPRTMASIRPKDDSRAKKRVEVRTRKEEEKMRKMEEIARLKALKLKEIQEKLAKIKEVTGNDELAFKDEDIEGDFDPEEHDRRMRAIFDEQYYGDADNEKPVFPDLDEELEIENWENYEEAEDTPAQGTDGPHCEDEDFNMDAEYDPKRARTTLLEEIKETLGKKRRNRKRKSKLAKLLESEKPKFVPDVMDKTYDQFMDEYYKMDCEDVIGGDLPTRFKYRETVPNSFGLTIEEILLADDRELNKWASLKKTVKQRPEQVEKCEVKTYNAKAADVQLKKKILPSLFKDLPEEPEVVVPIEGKKKKKKKKNKTKTDAKVDYQPDSEIVDNIKHDDIEDQLTSNKAEELNKSEEIKTKKKKKQKILNSNAFVSEKSENENKGPLKNNLKTSDPEPVTNSHKNTNNEEKTNKSKTKQTSQAKEVSSDVNKGIQPKSKTEMKISTEITDNKTVARKQKKKNYVTLNNIEVTQQGNTSQENLQGKLRENKVIKLKRKLDENPRDGPLKKKNKFNPANKKDFKNKNNKMKGKNTNKNKVNGKEDLMSKLSDERLKAYGLNPKKYRSFLKYKKF